MEKSKRNGYLERKLMSTDDRNEMLGCIIDIFDDYLEEQGVIIQNEERKKDDDSPAIIYGSHYDMLTSKIEETLKIFGLLNARCFATGKECKMCTNECANRC